VFLVVNGGVMMWTEYLRGKRQTEAASASNKIPERSIADLTWRDALIIGGAQAFALIPGISRSGATMCVGLLARMRHDEAASYTFMLATPLIAAAGVLEVPTLVQAGSQVFAMAVVGGLCAAVTAYLSLRFLTRYFRFGTLIPFAYYCIAVGLAGLIFVTVHGA
jgi:undecaprenyl-diphosphatase